MCILTRSLCSPKCSRVYAKCRCVSCVFCTRGLFLTEMKPIHSITVSRKKCLKERLLALLALSLGLLNFKVCVNVLLETLNPCRCFLEWIFCWWWFCLLFDLVWFGFCVLGGGVVWFLLLLGWLVWFCLFGFLVVLCLVVWWVLLCFF